ncbi:hypothetical protein ACOBQX_00730 [Actinokineospora sp. G85]|uniref:NHL domain-containing protein n=1 Tax=Actinokineospora sp. G85 TaxID=3406626 RepID=UPI003C73B2C7
MSVFRGLVVAAVVVGAGGVPAVADGVSPSRWAGDEPGTEHVLVNGVPDDQVRLPVRPENWSGATGLAVAADGSVYASVVGKVLRIDSGGLERVVADSSGRFGRRVELPSSVAADARGGVYFDSSDSILGLDSADEITSRGHVNGLERVAASPDGTVFATSPDGVRRVDDGSEPVPVARVEGIEAIAVTADSAVLFTQRNGHAVQRVGADGVVSAVAGSAGRAGFAGDGGPASSALLNAPRGLAVAPDGTRYIADTGNNRVRRVAVDGTITTIAGTGERAETGDGGPATRAALVEPSSIAVAPDGTVYVGARESGLIRKITPDGAISTFADLDPNHTGPFQTTMRVVHSFAVGPDGAVHLAVRAVDAVLRVTAEGGLAAVDTGPAGPEHPNALAADPDGSLLVGGEHLARLLPDGTSQVVADHSSRGAEFEVDAVAVAPGGTVYFADNDKVFTMRAGDVVEVFTAPEGAGLRGSLATGPDGSLYVVVGNRVHRVRDGEDEVVAGRPREQGDGLLPPADPAAEDGGPATEASLQNPTSLATTPDGSLYISTFGGIRRVDPAGTIETIRPAASTQDSPPDLATGPGGDLYLLDREHNNISVLVRPSEMDGQSYFPWTAFWVAGAALALIVASVGALRARRRDQSRVLSS